MHSLISLFIVRGLRVLDAFYFYFDYAKKWKHVPWLCHLLECTGCFPAAATSSPSASPSRMPLWATFGACHEVNVISYAWEGPSLMKCKLWPSIPSAMWQASCRDGRRWVWILRNCWSTSVSHACPLWSPYYPTLQHQNPSAHHPHRQPPRTLQPPNPHPHPHLPRNVCSAWTVILGECA